MFYGYNAYFNVREGTCESPYYIYSNGTKIIRAAKHYWEQFKITGYGDVYTHIEYYNKNLGDHPNYILHLRDSILQVWTNSGGLRCGTQPGFSIIRNNTTNASNNNKNNNKKYDHSVCEDKVYIKHDGSIDRIELDQDVTITRIHRNDFNKHPIKFNKDEQRTYYHGRVINCDQLYYEFRSYDTDDKYNIISNIRLYAIIYNDGDIEMFNKYEQLSDQNGSPAICFADGGVAHMHNDVFHNDNGEAAIIVGNHVEYHKNGNLHNRNGLSINYDPNDKDRLDYYINGKNHTKQAYTFLTKHQDMRKIYRGHNKFTGIITKMNRIYNNIIKKMLKL